MTKLEWFQNQLSLAGEGRDNFLGTLKQELVDLVAAAGEGLSRPQFLKLLGDRFPRKGEPFHEDYLHLGAQLESAEFSEVWDTSSAPVLPEVTGKFRHGLVELPDYFVKLGGYPDWIQDEDYPICEECDREMALLIQISSLPYEITKKHRELDAFTFGDLGNLYVFQCPVCRSCRTSEQCS